MEDKKKKVVVIGAGPAGITATHYLRNAGVDVLCLEKGDEVGGRVGYLEKNGYVYNKGAHLYTPQYHESKKFVEYVGLEDKTYCVDKFRAGFWRKGRFHLVGLGSFMQEVRWLSATLRFRGIPFTVYPGAIKFLRAMLKEIKNVSPEKLAVSDYFELDYLSDISVHDYALQHGGEKVARYLADPMWAIVLGGDAKEASATSLIAEISDAFVESLLRKRTTKVAFVLENGLYQLYNAIYEKEKESYRLSTPVKKVVLENNEVKGVEIEGEFIEADHVICATSATVPKQMIPDLPKSISSMLETVKYAKYYMVALADNGKFLPEEFFIGVFPSEENKPAPMFKFAFATNKTRKNATPKQGGHSVQMATNFEVNDYLKGLSEEKRKEVIFNAAKEMFPKLPDNPGLFEVAWRDEAACLGAPGQMNAVLDYLKNHVDDVKGLQFAGDYMSSMTCSEAAIEAGKKAAERVIAKING